MLQGFLFGKILRPKAVPAFLSFSLLLFPPFLFCFVSLRSASLRCTAWSKEQPPPTSNLALRGGLDHHRVAWRGSCPFSLLCVKVYPSVKSDFLAYQEN